MSSKTTPAFTLACLGAASTLTRAISDVGAREPMTTQLYWP